MEDKVSLKEKLLAQEKELSLLKSKYEEDKRIMEEHIREMMREMMRLEDLRKRIHKDKEPNGSNCISDHPIIQLYSPSNVVVITSSDGGHLDMDLLRYYCTGSLSGGKGLKPVVRIKAVTQNCGEYHVWYQTEEDAQDVIDKERHVFLGRKLTVNRFLGNWPPYHSITVSNMSSDVANEDYLTRYFRSTKYGSGSDYFDRVEMMTDDDGKPMAKVTFKDPYPPIAMVSNSLNEIKLGEEVKVEVCNASTTGTKQQGLAETTDTTTGTEQQGLAGTADTTTGTEQQGSAGTADTTTDTEQQGSAGTTDTTTDTGTTSGSKSSNIIQPISKTGRLPLRPLLAKYLQQYPEVLDELAEEAKVSATIEESVVVIKPITDGSATSDATDNPVESMADAVKRFRTKLLGSVSYSDADVSLPTGSNISHYSDEIKQCNKLNVLHELNQNRVTLVGNRAAVVEMVRYIEKLCGRPVQVVQECFLDPQDYTFFVKCGYEKAIANPPNVKILKNEVEWSILVLGSIDDVYQFVYQLLPTMLSHTRVPVNMSEPVVQYLRGKSRMRIEGVVSRKGIAPYIFPPDGVDHCNISLLCADEEAVEQSKSSIGELKKMFPF